MMRFGGNPGKETVVAPDAAIELRGVAHSLAGREVLRGIDLTLTERRIGLVGRNGSGKSTLARVLAGLIAPDSGAVTIGGTDVARDRRAALRLIGVLFQNPDHQIIFPTVAEELAFGLKQLCQSRAEAAAGADAMLDRFGKRAWRERSVTELSQGQRHLLCLMAVLAMSPAVILLDEPFSGLDIPTTRQLRRMLDGVAPRVLQITHDPSALDGYDRVIWLDEGRVRADGPPEETLALYLAAMEEDADAGTDLFD
ncbi:MULTISPECIES: energy-coupling factor ABC transporter ATP-binding protein [Roseobacteraceae]|uniref:energy-coupling factor ABC transporter ATP-binding protein n=1 Tax=Roseobacteraceae TaxID=2854170 RepID=UPI004057FB18